VLERFFSAKATGVGAVLLLAITDKTFVQLGIIWIPGFGFSIFDLSPPRCVLRARAFLPSSREARTIMPKVTTATQRIDNYSTPSASSFPAPEKIAAMDFRSVVELLAKL